MFYLRQLHSKYWQVVMFLFIIQFFLCSNFANNDGIKSYIISASNLIDFINCLAAYLCFSISSMARLAWAYAAPARISAATQMASIISSLLAPLRIAWGVCALMQ